jgi:hypothetical protein
MGSDGWAQRRTLKEEAMLSILILNIRNWLVAEEGQVLAKHGRLLGLIAAMLMVALALLGGFFLAYLGTEAAAAMGWYVGGAG